MSKVQIEASWNAVLEETFNQPWFAELAAYLKQEKAAGKTNKSQLNSFFNNKAYSINLTS